jgi:MtfA peptidase
MTALPVASITGRRRSMHAAQTEHAMVPYPRRIRATRRWAVAEAAAAAVLAAVVLMVFRPTPAGCIAAVALGAFLATAVYRSETRIVRRRLAIMARTFPGEWEAILRQRIPFYASLVAGERLRFQHLVAIFLDEKPIRGVGCEVDDTCRLLVAASAVIPVFAFPAWEYSTLRKILVRPEPFDAEFAPANPHPSFAQGMIGRAGLLDGVMILSKPELLAGFSDAAGKHHVGIHEFAHLIDQADGAIDGIPTATPRECLRPWTTLVHERLSGHAVGDSGIPSYGYTNEAEFFAVVSEYFFQSPEELAQRDPDLYAVLERIFRQDMLGRSRLMNR